MREPRFWTSRPATSGLGKAASARTPARRISAAGSSAISLPRTGDAVFQSSCTSMPTASTRAGALPLPSRARAIVLPIRASIRSIKPRRDSGSFRTNAASWLPRRAKPSANPLRPAISQLGSPSNPRSVSRRSATSPGSCRPPTRAASSSIRRSRSALGWRTTSPCNIARTSNPARFGTALAIASRVHRSSTPANAICANGFTMRSSSHSPRESAT